MKTKQCLTKNCKVRVKQQEWKTEIEKDYLVLNTKTCSYISILADKVFLEKLKKIKDNNIKIVEYKIIYSL